MIDFFNNISRYRMEYSERINLITKHFNPDCQFFIDGNDLDRIPADSKGSPRKSKIVSRVLHGNERPQKVIAVNRHSSTQLDHSRDIFFRRTKAVNT